MRYLRFGSCLVIAIFLVLPCSAQLSPGDLAKSHAQLEGVFNCTQCHTIGQKVSNDKCLACHAEIKTRVQDGKGFHASADVKGKDCSSCHSDHHGRSFKMVRIDEASFDHGSAGFALTGKHQQIDCRQCHKPDLIHEEKIKKLPNTYLGLRANCAACHNDVHQNTLSTDCTKCHNTDAFAPATKFNHSKTNFPLVGKHTKLECTECHALEQRNGQQFQRFSDIAFGKCTSCHKDAHQGKLKVDCRTCHTEEGWATLGNMKKFDHGHTGFTLQGKHKTIDCKACHQLNVGPTRAFQDHLNIQETNCIHCHKDPHENRFGIDCASCHNEQAWNKVMFGSNFNHAMTGFSLEGAHASVQCASCHSSNMTDPIPHGSCTDCHTDFHQGIFLERDLQRLKEGKKIQDCSACHTVASFKETNFGIDQHAETKFALEGAHQATPCISCHMDEKQNSWNFRDLGKRCVDCHVDIHAGTISEKFYPNQDCTTCHNVQSWADPRFDHSKTRFQLQHAHLAQKCTSCHKLNVENVSKIFLNLPMDCASCHADVHRNQFADQQGKTDCSTCHTDQNWSPDLFNHSSTKFPLEGKHAQIECKACHKPILDQNNLAYTAYIITRFECKDCHQ
jgi:hypothetical protein